MDTVTKKIVSAIESFERGRIFFSDDFIGVGSDEAIRQVLSRLVDSGLIVRLAHGVYCYPEIDDRLGLGVICPTNERIAEALARRCHARIVPTGDYALNVLGLSTQVPMNYVFLTDGPSRRIDVANGSRITFKRVAPRNFSFTNRLAMLVTSALKTIKSRNVTAQHIDRIKSVLQNEDREAVMTDIGLMPAWIRDIVVKAYA